MNKSCILRGHARFRNVLTRGRRFEGVVLRCFILLPPSTPTGVRFGFVVPSRKFKAVTRNRLKRLMRESVSRRWSAWDELTARLGKGLEIVVYYKGSGTLPTARVQLRDIDRELEHLRSKAAVAL